MAFYLERQKTGSTPYVLVDEEKSFIKIEGESYHENVIGFFKEINDWLENYLESDFDTLTFECGMEYFNSATAKLLLNILINMDEHASDNKKIIVNWISTEDNDIIIECGEDFQEEMSNLKFNLVVN